MEKILILTNHFYPETFRVNDLAFDLVKRGFDVTVLTGIPDYPQGKFFNGYGLFKRRVERVNGVNVVRVALIPRGNGKALRLMLNYASSLVSFMFHALYQAIFHKYDAIFIHNTSPATICLPAILIKKIRKTPIIHWVLDMWPENLVAGGIHSQKVFNMVDVMMKFIYRNCDHIQISSLGFRKLLVERGVPNEKIEYLPNWSDESIAKPQKVEIKQLPEGFKILFAGNMGNAQNLENVLHAARLTKERKDIQWVFLGDGRKKDWVEGFVSENGLTETVHLLGRQPVETMSSYFEKADVMLVSLCDEVSFNLTLPAKVQAYMSCSKPILGLINGETQDIISAADCGWGVNANDYQTLAEKVCEISQLPKKTLAKLGDNAFAYYQKNFKKTIVMDRLGASIHRVCNR